MKKTIVLMLLLPIWLLFASAPRITQSLDHVLSQQEKIAIPVWIYFRDKGPDPEFSTIQITERALDRRQKMNSSGPLLTYNDIPLYEPYIEQIKPFLKKIRVRSKWLNAISADITPGNIGYLAEMEIIRRLDLVKAYHKPRPVEDPVSGHAYNLYKRTVLDYGPSFTQLDQIGVTALHDQGNFGQGVLICLLDDGFNLYKIHECFDSFTVVDTWDFINNDRYVDDPGASPVEGWHGTKTLSAIAGFKQGQLIGPAYKAAYLLGKTEDDNGETPVEEDYWVAGLEWAEMQGADLVSSSLGYIDWYTWEDMDGKTAVTTIAAGIAIANGMIIVNSAGNEGYSADENTLIAPADGELVIAVGAVTSSGERSAFSSVGPTADGRIKPDVAAMGSSVYVAASTSPTAYTYSLGTSFSCPLVAGAIAQLLSADSELSPVEVREALFSTASRARKPNNLV
jgi:subtilisin family serine protease